ncbi:MAG TPA: bifunctional serine/threonine-protein kinase/formylglycine-generating enzyme family protein [Terriglobales bacterium]|nr:bifunctional serine/threonine-protein kinase/formylglycine-generating enzyme family protein [Terriglobales bacterium]
MTNEQWQRAKELLHQALELAPEERAAFLDRVCSSDHSLRKEIEAFLASSDQLQSSFLQSSASQVTLRPGMKLGEYEVQKLVGSGGMGEVYCAHDSRLNRDVAIKVLPPFLSNDPDRLRRFEQEARAAAALNHPNILVVHQMGTYESTPYMVCELLEGDTLRRQLAAGPLQLRKVVDYGVQVAHGLAAAHEKGIVHRDLKPENLFVTTDGRVKILDFGLAKLMRPPEAPGCNPPDALEATQPGMVMGTFGYMSPEQVRGQPADHRADIFAFGAILWEMLTGKRAFQKATSVETMSVILNEDPPEVSQITTGVPPGLQRVVHRCLEKNPAQRFQSASDLAFALEASSDSGVSSTSVAKPARIGAIAVAGLVVVIAAVVLVAWFFWPHPSASPVPSVALQAQTGDKEGEGGEEHKSKLARQKKAADNLKTAAVVIPLPPKTSAASEAAGVVTNADKVKVNPLDGLKYVWIPPGKFMMGCSPDDVDCYPDEKPAHEVTITKGFWIGQTEVTQAAYEHVVGRNPSSFLGEDLPVDSVNWFQAHGYCSAIGMRLPTEAEWEYATRGGKSNNWSLGEIAWWSGNSAQQTHAVAQKQPNGYGLYDSLGNVAEWTADWYEPYTADPVTDPQGPSEGEYRITRGGSWLGGLRNARWSSRVTRKPGVRGTYIGIRCAGEMK